MTSPAMTRTVAPSSAVLTYSPLQNLAVFISLAYLICAYGRVPETFLPIPALAFILGILGLGATFASGGMMLAAGTRSGIMLLVITVWFIACIPFSAWPGGSLALFKNIWIKSVALFFMIAGTVVTLRHYVWMTTSLAIASTIIIAAARVFGSGEDRLGLELGALTNPNDFAAHLLIVMPLLLFFPMRSMTRLSSWICIGIMGAMMILVLKTGSRGGLLTLIAFGAYRFLRGSMKTRATLIALTLCALLVAPLVVSSASLQRYVFMFGGDVTKFESNSRELEFAEGSSESRLLLLRASVIATLVNPIFGVGPGQFSSYMADFTTQRGSTKALWAQTHNSFTQMSSECGLLPGVLFVLITIRVFQNSRKVRLAAARAGHADLHAAADALGTAVVSFVLAAFFGNFAYFVYLPLLAASGEALYRIASAELDGRQSLAPSHAF